MKIPRATSTPYLRFLQILSATLVAVSRGDAPKLFAYSTDKSSLAVFDATGKLKYLKTAAPFGELATQLDVQ